MSKLIPHGGNDNIETPIYLAEKIVGFLQKECSLTNQHRILEPCCGENQNFAQVIQNCLNPQFFSWYDLRFEKTDFFDEKKKYDWIITNPPWSKTRAFLNHAMTIAPNICFLVTVNHMLGLKARLRDMESQNYWPTQILLLDTPEEFPQSGFQLGACVIQKTNQKHTIFQKYDRLDNK